MMYEASEDFNEIVIEAHSMSVDAPGAQNVILGRITHLHRVPSLPVFLVAFEE